MGNVFFEITIIITLDEDDAKALYKAGADYVVLPHLVGGAHSGNNKEQPFRRKNL